jgi:hypothetical protein
LEFANSRANIAEFKKWREAAQTDYTTAGDSTPLPPK